MIMPLLKIYYNILVMHDMFYFMSGILIFGIIVMVINSLISKKCHIENDNDKMIIWFSVIYILLYMILKEIW